jgi:hypothetical protein
MATPKYTTVASYLDALSPADRPVMEALRKLILANLGRGFEEGIQYNAIGYYVPHSVFPSGYHCDPKQPLPYIGLARQKSHFGLYLFNLYTNSHERLAFEQAWKATGKKLDMGASCVRFKKLEDVPLEVIAAMLKSQDAASHVRNYQAALQAGGRGVGGSGGGTNSAKPGARKSTKKIGKKATKKLSKKTSKKASKKR